MSQDSSKTTPTQIDHDEQEIEVMPGVYMTDYSKRKRKDGETDDAKPSPTDNPLDFPPLLPDGTLDIDTLHLKGYTTEQLLEHVAKLEEKVEQLKALKAAQMDIRHSLEGMTPVQQLEFIRVKRNELERNHKHLIYSQEQLLVYLSSDEKDPVLQEAYDENCVTLKTQEERLQQYSDIEDGILSQLGPHYQNVPRANPLQSPSMTSTTETTTTAAVAATTTTETQPPQSTTPQTGNTQPSSSHADPPGEGADNAMWV